MDENPVEGQNARDSDNTVEEADYLVVVEKIVDDVSDLLPSVLANDCKPPVVAFAYPDDISAGPVETIQTGHRVPNLVVGGVAVATAAVAAFAFALAIAFEQPAVAVSFLLDVSFALLETELVQLVANLVVEQVVVSTEVAFAAFVLAIVFEQPAVVASFLHAVSFVLLEIDLVGLVAIFAVVPEAFVPATVFVLPVDVVPFLYNNLLYLALLDHDVHSRLAVAFATLLEHFFDVLHLVAYAAATASVQFAVASALLADVPAIAFSTPHDQQVAVRLKQFQE